MSAVEQSMIEKIRELPRERIAEVEGFVDFLRARETSKSLTRDASRAAEPSFAAIWNNEEDAAYDRL